MIGYDRGEINKVLCQLAREVQVFDGNLVVISSIYVDYRYGY